MPATGISQLKMGTSFSKEWEPNPGNVDHKMEQRLLTGTALTAFVTGGALLGQAFTPDFLILMTPMVALQSAMTLWSLKTTAPVLDIDPHLTKHQAYHDICEKLIAKAGLDIKVDVRLYTGHARSNLMQIPNVRPGFDGHDWNMQIFPYKDSSGWQCALLVIGHKLAEHLTHTEITAQMAHEIGHLMSPRQHLTGATVFKHKYIPWMFAGALVHLSPWTAAGYAATFFNHHAGLLKIARMNEYKADRNAVALFPHSSAFLDGLEMIEAYDDFMRSLEPPLARLARKIRSEHDETVKRQARVLGNLAEVQKFYREHGIKNDLGDILPGTQKRHVADDQDINWREPGNEIARLVNVRGSWRKAALLKDLRNELHNAGLYRDAVSREMKHGPKIS